MKIRASATSPEITITDLGEVSAEEAVRLFHRHPWAHELEEYASMNDGTPPDLTLSAPDGHMVIAAAGTDLFDIEVCLPRERKLLGLWRLSKFYVLEGLSPAQVEPLIRAFFLDSLSDRHAAFLSVPR